MRVVHAEITETVQGLHYRLWVTEHGPEGRPQVTTFAPYERTVFGVDLDTPTSSLVSRLGHLVERSASLFRLG